MPRKRKSLVHHHENFKTSASSCASTMFGNSNHVKEKPQQRNAANARERARMRVLSRAFCRLKTTLPWVPADTKLSKLDTLRLASSYIAHLKGILRDDPFAPQEPLHPAINLTWPFGFSRGGGTGSRGGGSGSDEGEESDSNSDYWREVVVAAPPPRANSKDCIHLDIVDMDAPSSLPPSSTYLTNNSFTTADADSKSSMFRHFSNTSATTPAAMHLHSQHHHHHHQQINTSDGSSGLESNGLDFQ